MASATYNEETLQVTYKGKNIYDVLAMTVEKRSSSSPPSTVIIKSSFRHCMTSVWITSKLGQPATTLSGGEIPAISAGESELQRQALTGKTVFILDEPTTGLHTRDVKITCGLTAESSIMEIRSFVIKHNPRCD